MRTFGPVGYYREPSGPPFSHRGAGELGSFFTGCFSAGGGIGRQHCAVTDDGVRRALEYNCVRLGRHDPPPQAGIGVYDRGPDGLLAAARVYDDVEPPTEQALNGQVDGPGRDVLDAWIVPLATAPGLSLPAAQGSPSSLMGIVDTALRGVRG